MSTLVDVQRVMSMMLLAQHGGEFTATTKEIDAFMTTHPVGMVMQLQKDGDLVTMSCRECDVDDIIAAILGQIEVE